MAATVSSATVSSSTAPDAATLDKIMAQLTALQDAVAKAEQRANDAEAKLARRVASGGKTAWKDRLETIKAVRAFLSHGEKETPAFVLVTQILRAHYADGVESGFFEHAESDQKALDAYNVAVAGAKKGEKIRKPFRWCEVFAAWDRLGRVPETFSHDWTTARELLAAIDNHETARPAHDPAAKLRKPTEPTVSAAEQAKRDAMAAIADEPDR